MQGDPHWADWSLTQLEWAAEHGKLVINPIVYTEFSVWYDDREELEKTLTGFETTLEELPREALFLAGKAFRQYRARRGTRASVLPDFFIGAHAAVREMPVLTRDTARIRTYFPTVALLAPQRG
ncbi:type II toxin-antitoxin system VapC family toxin [Nitrosococcus oceani]|uniref:type II toxin-antitoxin system VapC family toxin n=1 Tax=Nitrosococcus oceani TaxID=1229 RepID=UPI001E3C9971|nr:DNA-binding protein [Nitrosococcus oceani]